MDSRRVAALTLAPCLALLSIGAAPPPPHSAAAVTSSSGSAHAGARDSLRSELDGMVRDLLVTARAVPATRRKTESVRLDGLAWETNEGDRAGTSQLGLRVNEALGR